MNALALILPAALLAMASRRKRDDAAELEEPGELDQGDDDAAELEEPDDDDEPDEEADPAETARAIVEQSKRDLEPLRDIPILRELANPGAKKPTAKPQPRPVQLRKPAAAPTGPSEAARAREAAEAAAAAAKRSQAPSPARPAPAPVRAAPRPAPAPVRRTAAPAPAPELEQALSLPEGYSPTKARAQAQAVVNHLRKAGGNPYDPSAARRNYARSVVATWQRFAGLVPDGIYGPRTVNALKYYGARNTPPPLFTKQSDGTHLKASDPRAAYVPPEER